MSPVQTKDDLIATAHAALKADPALAEREVARRKANKTRNKEEKERAELRGLSWLSNEEVRSYLSASEAK